MQSRGRIAAYISIAACIGAVMAGLLLLRQYRTKLRDSAEKAVSSCNDPSFALILTQGTVQGLGHARARNSGGHFCTSVRIDHMGVRLELETWLPFPQS